MMHRWPSHDAGYLYSMHVQLWLNYLDKIGFNDGLFDPSPVRERVEAFADHIIPMEIHQQQESLTNKA